MRCDWVRYQPTTGSGRGCYECRRCGRRVSMGYDHIHPEMYPDGLGDCPKGDAPSPGAAEMVVRYGAALARWAAAGMPTRPEDEIDRYYRRCTACEHYDAAGHRCRRCGCRVNGDAAAWRNKIAMATERCPLGRWPDEPAAADAAAETAEKAPVAAAEPASPDAAREPSADDDDAENATEPADEADAPDARETAAAPSPGAPSALGADAFRADLRAEHDGPTLDAASLYDFFERVYVINLHTRPDRREEFFRRLDRGGWPFRRPTVYPAIHGDTVGVPEEFSSGGGAYGCRMSHLRILQDCLMAGVKSVLILEDDADLRPGFAAAAARFLARVPADWQGLMLGGQHHAVPDPTDDDEVVRVRYAQRTHAYAARPEYMRALQRRWGNSTVHIDWRMRDWQHQWRVYAPSRWLIGQAGGRSDIAGLEKPPEWWNRADPHSPVVVLRASREVFEQLIREGGWHGGRRRDPKTGCDVGLPPCADPTLSGEERSGRIRRWIECVGGEAEEMGAVCTIWHPGITREQVAAAWRGPVVELAADTADEARRCLPGWIAARAAPMVESRESSSRVVAVDQRIRRFAAFYHVACINNWRDVVAEQTAVFRRVGLDPVTVAVGASDANIRELNAMGLRVVESHPDCRVFETPTLQRLWQWSREHAGGAVLYCHTKGVSAPDDPIKPAWRRLMMRSVVERWQENTAQLDRYDAVGFNLIARSEHPHFSGNFWVASTDWVAGLPSPEEHRRSRSGTLCGHPWERMHAEMWVLSRRGFRALSLVARDTHIYSGNAAYALSRYDSDKHTLVAAAFSGVEDRTDKNTTHCYLPFYAHVLSDFIARQTTILKVGVQRGGSLDGWAAILRHRQSIVIGVDLAPQGNYRPRDDRIRLIVADATKPGNWLNDLPPLDVVIDDGSHQIDDQLATFRLLWPKINHGGLYVIEDVQSDEDALRLRDAIPAAAEEDLREVKGRYDDRIIWTRKPMVLT